MIKVIKKLLGTNVLVQLIGLLIYPILIWHYAISDLSKYGMLYGGMTIISVLITLKIENLFFNVKVKEAFYIYSLYFKVFFFPVFFIFLFLYLLFYLFEFNSEKVDLILILALSGLFLGGFNIVYNYLVRVRNHKYNLLKIFRGFLELIIVFICALNRVKIEWLFLFVAFSYFVVIIYPIYKSLNIITNKYPLKSKIKFIVYDLFLGLFNNIYLYSPNYFLYFGGMKELSGYYFLINRIFGVPSLMIAQSLSTALKQNLASKTDKNYRSSLDYFSEVIFKKIYFVYIGICFISIFVFYILNMFYENIFNVFIVVLPLLILRFKFLSYSGLFYILKAYRENLKIQLFLLVISISASLLGWYLNNSWISLSLYTIFTVIVYELAFKNIFNRENIGA